MRELGTLGKKEEQLKPRISMMNHSGKQELNKLNETRIRITLCVSFTNLKLMTNNGFGILLILEERIKIDIAPTWEGIERTTERVETTNK